MFETNFNDISEGLKKYLPAYLPSCRWFASKTKDIAEVDILDCLPMKRNLKTYMLILRVVLDDDSIEHYSMPLSVIDKTPSKEQKIGLIFALDNGTHIIEGIFDAGFRDALFETLIGGKTVEGINGVLSGFVNAKSISHLIEQGKNISSKVLPAEQSNSSVIYNDSFFLKLYRRLEIGPHPEAEMTHFLSEAGFTHVPPFIGSMKYMQNEEKSWREVALLQEYVKNIGDGWTYFTAVLKNTIKALKSADDADKYFLLPLKEEINRTYAMASLLGKRTAEMHLALSSDRKNDSFAPLPFKGETKKEAYAIARLWMKQAMKILKDNIQMLPSPTDKLARNIIDNEKLLIDRLKYYFTASGGEILRIHGDYHLGQLLFTGDDFFIIDFEGEPARSLIERRKKQSPLKDVSGMIRSLHYAANYALKSLACDDEASSFWAKIWYDNAYSSFLSSYRQEAMNASFLPADDEEFNATLKAFLMEKVFYEICYEFNNRPDWVYIPLKGIESVIN
jgi:maltose alpha-D-glucosyltransferase/alpha-amylase